MSAHTQGPWRVEEGTTLVWGACNVDDPTTYGMGYPIAECRITPSASWAKGPNEDVGEANARLIAAAPDLLEALKAVESWAEQANPAGYGGLRAALYGKVFAAIAKAEGRS